MNKWAKNKNKTYKDQPTNFQIAFPPSFCFTHMKITPYLIVALLSALIKARNVSLLGER